MFIKIDPKTNGAIAHLSAYPTTPNIVDTYDAGRFIQPSVYSVTQQGGVWMGQQWPLNAIVGGTAGYPPVRWEGDQKLRPIKPGDIIKSVGQDWTLHQPSEYIFETSQLDVNWINFKAKFVGIKKPDQIRDQEFPAIFLKPQYTNIWVGDKRLDHYQLPKVPSPKIVEIPKNAAIHVLDDKGYGLRLLAPSSTRLAYYHFGVKGTKSSCTYIAPLVSTAWGDDVSVNVACFVSNHMGNGLLLPFRKG